MRARGKGRGGLLLGRFYFSKWLTIPVLGHRQVLVALFVNVKGLFTYQTNIFGLAMGSIIFIKKKLT